MEPKSKMGRMSELRKVMGMPEKDMSETEGGSMEKPPPELTDQRVSLKMADGKVVAEAMWSEKMTDSEGETEGNFKNETKIFNNLSEFSTWAQGWFTGSAPEAAAEGTPEAGAEMPPPTGEEMTQA